MLAKRNIVVEGPSDATYVEHVLKRLGRADVRLIVAGGAAAALDWLRQAEPEADLLGWVRLVVLWDSDQGFRDLRKQLTAYTRDQDYFVVEPAGAREGAVEMLIPPEVLEQTAQALADEGGGSITDVLTLSRRGAVTVGERFKIPLAQRIVSDWPSDRHPEVWAKLADLVTRMLTALG